MPVIAKSRTRAQFFDDVYQDRVGYVCIATSDPAAPRSRFKQKFFDWPKHSVAIENYILDVEDKFNVYYCPTLLSKMERKKEHCLPTNVVWADLDEADPSKILPPPQAIIKTSPNRWQALWFLTTDLEPALIEAYNKRLAYAYRQEGVDPSGWDLTQLLRVPLTKNFKHNPPTEIEYARIGEHTLAPPLVFEVLPQLPTDDELYIGGAEVPSLENLPSADNIIYKYSASFRDKEGFISLMTNAPEDDEDWSRSLWKLIHICLEAGMTDEEAFVVSNDSACNKYLRDKRPIAHLWRDVQKAREGHSRITTITANFKPLSMPTLVDEKEKIRDTLLIDRYRSWASEATDAVTQFHDLNAMILLSTVIANSVRLETSSGILVPNLWGMILGDSTLSRKTTSMRMVTDIIMNIDPELVLATDGSAEGLLTGLENRPNRTSMYYRDEVSGLFHSINRKEYLAGMPETLTALYDVPPLYTRRLRKETIRIESPVFIFFGGGVKDEVFEALNENYILSGFVPRFLVVSGETDMERLRRTGPPTEVGQSKKARIIEEVADLYENYATDVVVSIGGQKATMPPRIMAVLSDKAWSRYGDIEDLLVKTATECSIPNLALPTFVRLSNSILKMAVIIAASRQEPKDETVLVDEVDVITAAYYGQMWGVHSIEVIMNAGKKVGERLLDKIADIVRANPGILKSTIMQHYHLSRRDADEILGTLEDRQRIRREKRGRGFAYFVA